MKKFAVIIMLLICFERPAHAFVPFVIPPVAIAIVTTAAVTGIYYGLAQSGAVPQIDLSGNIKRATTAAYAYMGPTSPVLVSAVLTASMTLQALKNLANAHPTVYPNVKLALSVNSPNSYAAPSNNTAIGQSITMANGTSGVVDFTDNNYASNNSSLYGTTTSPTSLGAGRWQINVYGGYNSYGSGSMTAHIIRYGTTTTPPPTIRDASTTEIVTVLSTPTGGVTKSNYSTEIDKMYQDPAYVPVFTDTTTGLPWLPPAGVLTPPQLAAWNAAGAATQAREIAAAQSGVLVASAQTAADQALIRAQAAAVVLAADPTNPALIAERDRTLALSNTAATALAGAQTTQAQISAQTATIEDTKAQTVPQTVAGLPAMAELKTVDFTPFKELVGLMAVTYPFNLPTSIGSYYSALSGGAATAPIFDLPLPLAQSIHVDLSLFNPIAVLIRYMVGILVTCGILFYIVHFFRGVS